MAALDMSKPADYMGENMEEEEIPEETPMKDFYRGKTVFLTGGTGFLGQLFVEKLLRSGVKWIYLLARPKKGKSPEERLNELFVGSLYSKLFKTDNNYLKRIRIIEGDLLQLQLGISESDLADIQNDVQIVLHSAADVRFDEKLRKLLMINVRGTRELLKIAETIKNLEVVSYISTAFSNCNRQNIDEVFYETAVDPDIMIRIAEKYHDDPSETMEILQDRIIMPWPNTYVYTKSLCEEVVRRYGEKLPICVIRPTIIISTHEDPVPAWCNNIYGLNGVLVACGMGVLRLMPLNRKIVGDVVCADFVINSTLAAIWVTHENNKQNKITLGLPKEVIKPEIYHVCTTPDRPAKWGEIADAMNDEFTRSPSKKMLWKHCPNTTTCPFMWKLLSIYYHVIPALLLDVYLTIKKKKVRMLPVYRKVQRFMVALTYFMQNEFKFTNDNMKKVIAKMSKHDQDFFPSDIRRYNWSDFSYNYCHGLKLYIGMESLQDIPAAKKRFRKLVFFHYLVVSFYYMIHLAAFYYVFKYFGVIDNIRNTIYDAYDFIQDPNA